MRQRPADSPSKTVAVLGGATLVVGVLIWALRSDSPVSEPGASATAAAPAPQRANDGLPVATRPAPPSAQPAPANPPTAPASSAIPLTALPLRLLVISARAGGRHSFAQIADLQHGHEQLVVEGTVLQDRPHVVLARIEEDGVLLDNYGVTEKLLLDPSGQRLPELSDAPRYEPSAEEREQRRELGRRLRNLTDQGAERKPTTEVGGLLAQADVRPLFDEDGALHGVQLDEIEPGSVFDGAGLRNGDVVTAVNGVSVGEPAMIAGLATDLITSDQLEIAVEREGGAEEVVTVSTQELLESAAAYLESGGELPTDLGELLPPSADGTAPEL